MTDVNEIFAEQQRAGITDFDQRVADGRLIPLSGGRYRVNEPGSWDDGETWTQRQAAGAMQPQLLPQHGLDTTTGQVALYSAVPAWHGLGSVIPGGTADIDEVLHLGGIDFDVMRTPVLYRESVDGPDKVLAGRYVTVRTDTGAGLGVVGSRYQVLQNREIFEFLQDLVADHGVVWESAGALRQGRRVFVSMRLPRTIRIDAAGVNDAIIPFIVALNSHDGTGTAQVVVTPWRPVCGNTERFAVRDAHSRWGVRHTLNALNRVDEARRTLDMSVRYFDTFAAEQEQLARTDLQLADWDRLTDELWPRPKKDAATRAWTTWAARREALDATWAANTARLGRTAYAAARAVTEYLDWQTPVRPGSERDGLRGSNLAVRATAMVDGANDAKKTRAHRQLMTLVRHPAPA